jgi:hypothetical protein
MSTVARRFLASPVRLSSDTWKAISDLICQGDTSTVAEFEKVAGFASSLLNDGLFGENPMVVKNEGPWLRVYWLYGEDAISSDDKNEEPLTWKPTAKEWHAFLPCSAEEYDETTKSLSARSSKFNVYNIEKGVPDGEESSKSVATCSATVSVDWEAYKNL